MELGKLAPIRGQLHFRLSPHQMSLLVRKVSTNLKPRISFAKKSYLSFLNQDLFTSVNTKSGRAPRKLHFSSIFLSYMNTNLPRTNHDMVKIRLIPSFLIFITCSVVPCVTAVKNAISYLANIVQAFFLSTFLRIN